jgi:hypothetical protein
VLASDRDHRRDERLMIGHRRQAAAQLRIVDHKAPEDIECGHGWHPACRHTFAAVLSNMQHPGPHA